MNTKRPNLKKFVATVFSLFALFGSQGAVLVVHAANADVRVYASNTVAGYETTLKSSAVGAGQNATFDVTKPDGTVLNLAGRSGSNGIASVVLADYHTRKAGTYGVQVGTGTVNNSVVYPDKVSSENSVVSIDRTVVQPASSDFAKISVQLFDAYGNAIGNHIVQVFSNRSKDTVKNLGQNGVTATDGKIQFMVGSAERGVSEYSVLDATAGVMLAHKVSVAYVANLELMANVGGDFPFINIAKAAGPLNTFKIDGLPLTIQPNQNVNFTITAQDATNQVVQNYMGKVHFSADGANGGNAILPEDYTFKAEDLGVHQFSLGLSFKAAGTYKIVVTDLSNTLIKGTLDVVAGAAGGASQQVASGNISLDTPLAGTYSQKVQTLSGKAQSGYTVRLYDNQQEIGSVQATSEGKYAFQTSPLSEGQHSVYAVMFDNAQIAKGTSNTVLFSIKTSAPVVDQVILDPNHGIQPNSPINVKVLSQENLPQVAIVFDGNITQLSPGLENAGTYVGTVQAPATPGIYPVDVLLVDQLGNEGSYKAKAQVTVTNEVVVTQQTQQEEVPIQVVNTPPVKVRGLVTYPADKKVVLVWDAATDAETFVKHYRVYYGSDAKNLDRYVDTWDASTTWYVPNLENGKQLYFAVIAFDSEDLESTELSDVVSATPFGSAIAAAPVDPNLHTAATSFDGMNKTSSTGPEVLWLLFGSSGVGAVVRRIRRRK